MNLLRGGLAGVVLLEAAQGLRQGPGCNGERLAGVHVWECVVHVY
jgi:hypothetical protein